MKINFSFLHGKEFINISLVDFELDYSSSKPTIIWEEKSLTATRKKSGEDITAEVLADPRLVKNILGFTICRLTTWADPDK